VAPREVLRERARLGVDDEVDVALLIERDILVAMLCHRLEAHRLEQLPEGLGIGRGVLDELESVRAHGVRPQIGHDTLLVVSASGWAL